MKITHKLLLGLTAAIALAVTPAANAHGHHYHHGRYVYHGGYYGYYSGPRFYPYNAGPNPYYYGPFTPPGPAVGVTIVPHRSHFLFFF